MTTDQTSKVRKITGPTGATQQARQGSTKRRIGRTAVVAVTVAGAVTALSGTASAAPSKTLLGDVLGGLLGDGQEQLITVTPGDSGGLGLGVNLGGLARVDLGLGGGDSLIDLGAEVGKQAGQDPLVDANVTVGGKPDQPGNVASVGATVGGGKNTSGLPVGGSLPIVESLPVVGSVVDPILNNQNGRPLVNLNAGVSSSNDSLLGLDVSAGVDAGLVALDVCLDVDVIGSGSGRVCPTQAGSTDPGNGTNPGDGNDPGSDANPGDGNEPGNETDPDDVTDTDSNAGGGTDGRNDDNGTNELDAGDDESESAAGARGPSSPKGSGTLPLTGGALAMTIALGGTLFGAGGLLRSLTRSRTRQA